MADSTCFNNGASTCFAAFGDACIVIRNQKFTAQKRMGHHGLNNLELAGQQGLCPLEQLAYLTVYYRWAEQFSLYIPLWQELIGQTTRFMHECRYKYARQNSVAALLPSNPFLWHFLSALQKKWPLPLEWKSRVTNSLVQKLPSPHTTLHASAP